MIYYKYRSIKEFKYFMDILANKRLWASTYDKLNDPMEGAYTYKEGKFDKTLIEKLNRQKGILKICSLSKSEDNFLLWSHYADGHQGVAIGLSVDENKFPVTEVNYVDDIETINDSIFNSQTARTILSRKLKIWEYEEEVRIFVNGRDYVENVTIHEIICGSKMNRRYDYQLIKKIAERFDSSIKVYQKSNEIE